VLSTDNARYEHWKGVASLNFKSNNAAQKVFRAFAVQEGRVLDLFNTQTAEVVQLMYGCY
ncbi:MAG: hypothetical protein ACKPKO_63325, partial [Candidatus Fonsibacter sp.]